MTIAPLLDGRRVLVTGGSRGLGRGACEAFAEAGCDVAVLFRQRRNEADAVLEQCRAHGVNTVAVQADVANSESTEGAVAEAANALGGLDFVVANAGIGNPFVTLAETSDSRWRKIMGVNLDGVFNTMRAAVPYLKESSNQPAAVFVSTVGSLRGAPSQGTYVSAKAAVNELARTWALELAATGVRVNAVAPGIFETDMTEIIRRDLDEQAVRRRVPLGRLGTPIEFGRFLVMLCSPYSAYVTGEVIRIDGGMGA